MTLFFIEKNGIIIKIFPTFASLKTKLSNMTMKKIVTCLFFSIGANLALAENWKIDWSKENKYFDESEKVSGLYLESTRKGSSDHTKRYYTKEISYAKIDNNGIACVKIYEKAGGFFSSNVINGYLVNLSKVDSVESLGVKNILGSSVGVDRYTLKDGAVIESMKLDTVGKVYSCTKDEKGEIVAKTLKWVKYSISDGSELCKFDEEKAKIPSFEIKNLFNGNSPSFGEVTLGFGVISAHYIQKLAQGEKAKASFDECQAAEEMDREYRNNKVQFQKSVINDFIAAHGDPVARVEENLKKQLAPFKARKSSGGIAQMIGLPESDFYKENLERFTKPESPSLAEVNMTYLSEHDACHDSRYYTGDLSQIGYKKNVKKVLACLDNEGNLVRLDITLGGGGDIFEMLGRKYQLIEKTYSNQSKSVYDVISEDHRRIRGEQPIEPYIKYALFKGDDVVVRLESSESGRSSGFLGSSTSMVTYIAKDKYLAMQKSRAGYSLSRSAGEWFKSSQPKTPR